MPKTQKLLKQKAKPYDPKVIRSLVEAFTKDAQAYDKTSMSNMKSIKKYLQSHQATMTQEQAEDAYDIISKSLKILYY